jgi:PAS domain S-box-containing protein
MQSSPDSGLFQLMVDRVQDYAIFLLDPRGYVISWNTGARRIKQYGPQEIIGKHFSVFYTPEDIQRNWPSTELKRALMDGRFEDEGWRLKKDGSRFWANVIITALRDEKGQLLAYSKITRDLTERKRQDEDLRQSEERFRLLVDGVQDYAIYMLSPEGVVTSWNLGAHRIKGYDANEIIGKHFSRFYSGEDIEAGKPWAELAIARKHGRAEDEGWRLRKDGSRFWARVVVTALHDSEGQLRGFAKVTQDLTERRHSESLENAAKQLNDFIAVLAHELRNPLAPIRNAVTVLKNVKPGDSTFEPMRRAIDRQSTQLSRIVDDLLDISRITRGTFAIQRKSIDLGEIVSRAIEAARPGIDAANHVLNVDLPDKPIFVQGDDLRLTQALTNVLNNAARYTDPVGRIFVSVLGEGSGFVKLCIRDTGRGIEPEFIGSIFGMFVQGEDVLTKPQTGLGVGLALTRIIVELHHGTIEARSEGAGKGTEFIIRLPVAAAETAVDVTRPTAPAAKTASRRVLVVDDNVDAAVMLSALVKVLGHEVLTVHDGTEALQMAEGYRPEVILLDIGMPGMNGYEVARLLRARERSPQPVIVAVTGWGKPDDERRSREAGFDIHLVKPIEEAQLRQVFERQTGFTRDDAAH